MRKDINPCFMFPFTVVMVDDNQSFLENVSLKLGLNSLVKLYDKPEEAILFLTGKANLHDNLDKFLVKVNTCETDEDNPLFTLDYRRLYEQIYEADRFSEAAVVIVDYSMPKLNGIEFCERIKKLPIKKIMLTGEADHEVAVDAFNKGIIDMFILKDISDVIVKLSDAIKKLGIQYFCDLSNAILKCPADELLHSNEFVKLFDHWVQHNKIVEYYRCDRSGSYMGFNEKGEIFWLLIKADHEIDTFIEIAKSYGADQSILANLTSRENLLFLLSEFEKKKPISQWNNYMFPVTDHIKIGKEQYYYSIVSDKYFSIDKHRVVSLGGYC